MTIILSNSSPKISKSGVFGPKYKDFYFFAQNLAKFEGADFKYDNGFSKLLPQTPK